MPTTRTDNFNRANNSSSIGSPSDGGAAYTLVNTTGAIFSNGGYFPISGRSLAVLDCGSPVASVSVKLVTGQNFSGPVIRFASSTSYVEVLCTATTISLYTYNTGTETLIGSTYSGAVTDGDVIAVAVDGSNNYTVTQNGVTRVTGSSAYNATATKGGFISLTNGAVFDDLSVVGGAGASLTAGAATVTATAAGNALTTTAATNGTGSVTNQWQRAPATTGVFADIGGATGLTYSDTTAVPGAAYLYRCNQTDTTPTTVTTNVVTDARKTLKVQIVAIGDSVTAGSGLVAGQDPVTQAQAYLAAAREWEVNIVNAGIGGTQTSDWTPGTHLTAAKASAVSAFGTPNASTNIVYALIDLGINDSAAANHVSAATYNANITAIVNNLVSAGYTPVLNSSIYCPNGAQGGYLDQTSVSLLDSYRAQLDLIANGTTILRGSKLDPWGHFATNLATQKQSDQLHPTATGAAALGEMWGSDLVRLIQATTVTGVSGGAIIGG